MIIMKSIFVGALVGLAATYAFVRALLQLTQLANEPPAVSTSIPFIGPILEMARHKSRFHAYVRDTFGLPIYTLRLPGTRMYVVNSPSLVNAVQRLYKTISFGAIEAQITDSILLVSKHGKDVIRSGLMEDNSYTGAFAAAIHPATKPGANLDAMSRIALQTIAASLDKLQAEGPKSTTLFGWIRNELTLATTDGVYGPHNPLRDQQVRESWYQFEPKVLVFAMGLFPRLFARKAFIARKHLTEVFTRYLKAGHHEQGSALVQRRYQHNTRFGLTPEDTAGVEVGGLFAVLGNTAPACFWFIYHIFSDSAVLEECRAELEALVDAYATKQQSADDYDSHQQQHSTIGIASVKTKCPVLLSTLQEVLRYRSISVFARMVLEDEQLLDGKYHLQQGSMLMISANVLHSDTEAWGPTATVFDHRRFLPGHSSQSQDRDVKAGKGIPRSSYSPFGGGHVLCPGRHFAMTSLLAFAALLILRFDIIPEGEKWKEPTIENSSLAGAFPVPDDPIRVKIRPRDPSRRWRVQLMESDNVIGNAKEDLKS